MKNAIDVKVFLWYSIKENLVEFKLTPCLSYHVGEWVNDSIDSLLCWFIYISSIQCESNNKILILEENISVINVWSSI